MSRPRRSLRSRLSVAFGFFSLLTAVTFSGFCVLFMYVVEDHFFDRTLEQEAEHQYRHWAIHGTAAPVLFSATRLHAEADSFPPDLARHRMAHTGEYAGTDGRQYHVLRLSRAGYMGARYLVAEVSRELFVRPRLPYIAFNLGASALALVLVTLAAGLWLTRRALTPLSRLSALVDEVRPEELPQGFAGAFPDNEIGTLAVALERTIARIAKLIAREQQFTRDASHELRTPLTVIDGAAYLLARQPMAAPAAAQLERIVQASAGLQQTVNTLMVLAREDSAGRWSAERFAILPLVEACILRQNRRAERSSDVDIEVAIGADVQANCARDAFAILLDNLMSNALEHAPVKIRLSINDGWLVVADQGARVGPALRALAGRSGGERSGSAGFGLGLSISQRLAARAGIGLRLEHSVDGGVQAGLALHIAADRDQARGSGVARTPRTHGDTTKSL